jgi:hypothetical protein
MNVMVRMSNKLDPAYSIVRKFDEPEAKGKPARSGTVVLAARLDIDRSTVQKWTMARERGGTGGFIPFQYHGKILTFAEQIGIDLDPAEFVLRPEVAA